MCFPLRIVMKQAHHLQSYFVAYSRTAFSHKLFKEFWDGFVVYENKSKLIKENEVKFSGGLIDSDLSVSALCKAEEWEPVKSASLLLG